MSDNVIQFKQPPKKKPPRQKPPEWLKRALVLACTVALFAAAYAYFSLTNGGR